MLTKELGANTLKFIGAYRGLRSHVGTDDDGLYFDIVGSDLRTSQRQLSAELQLSRALAISYSVGIFVFRERSELPPFEPVVDILYTCGCFYPPGSLPEVTIDPRKLLNLGQLRHYPRGTTS